MYKVLVVEDEDIIRKGLVFTMDWQVAGCIVVGEASDGEQGLKEIERLKPDIVITDIKMPFKDGLEMLDESIRKYKYEAIIITGFSEFDYAKKAISLGVNEYILKPVDFDKLKKTLVNLSKKLDSKKDIYNLEQAIKDINLYKHVLDVQHISLIENANSLASKIMSYIIENYSDKITLDDLETNFQISKVTLNNKFKEDTTYTINDFINRYRILKSIELLMKDDIMVYQVALDSGFQDYKYYSYVFKKYVGYSPTDFIEKVLNK